MSAKLNNDQKRSIAFLDTMQTMLSESETDAMVMNRVFARGADPYSLVTVYEPLLASLADRFEVSPKALRDAIEMAHKVGPATLLSVQKDDTGGIPLKWSGARLNSQSHRIEAAWLFLVCFSKVPEGFDTDRGLAWRLQDFLSRGSQAHLTLVRRSQAEISQLAAHELQDIRALEFTWYSGVPMAYNDLGFYLGYKRKFPIVGVFSSNRLGEVSEDKPLYVGTNGTVDLFNDAIGFDLDKVLSSSFGMRFTPLPRPSTD